MSQSYRRSRVGATTRTCGLNLENVVVVFDDENECVAKFITLALEVGALLKGKRLHPTEMDILITVVHKPEARVNKIMKETLGECLQCTI